uniref:DUF2087 domain-containing protein n=1 Tax=Cellulomonas sp. HZM TaxID=1454010 RepID=UPI0012DEF35B
MTRGASRFPPGRDADRAPGAGRALGSGRGAGGETCEAERFLVRGRLERTPRRDADRDTVREHLVGRVLAPGEWATEREVTDRLAELADDPVRLRRDLVESGLLGR